MQRTFCLTDQRFQKVTKVTDWNENVIFASGLVLQIQCSCNTYYAMTCSVPCCKVRLKNVGTVMTCHIVLRVQNKILYSCKIFIIYKKTELDMGWGRFIASIRPTYHADTSPHKFQLFSSLQNFEQTPFSSFHLTRSPDGSVGMYRGVRIVARNGITCGMAIRLPVRPSFRPSVFPRVSVRLALGIPRMCVRFYIEDFYENLPRI